MKDLDTVLLDSTKSGVYAAPAAIDLLERQARVLGLAWLELDLAGVCDKAAFLERCREAFGLPAAFGRNWDALADSLADLSWWTARGHVVFCRRGGEFARRSPEDFATALAILDAAASYWREQGEVFLALLDAATGASAKLKLKPLPV